MRKFRYVRWIFVGLTVWIIGFSGLTMAQEEVPLKLGEVVVTATRSETPVENLPVSVTVITKDDIEKIHAKTVDDVLNKAAGVHIRRGKGLSNTGSHTTLYMRGTGDSTRVLILKDGIPLNTTYIGSVNFWNTISVDDIEKIEIVRGASSALYGSNAMGGVINIITTRPAGEKTTGSVSFEGGTFGTYIGNANISTATDKFGLRASAGHKKTDGYEYYKGDEWKDYYKTPENELTNVSLGGDIPLGESVLKLDYEYLMEDSLSATSTQYDTEAENNNIMLGYSRPIGEMDLSIKSYYFDYSYVSKARKYDSTTEAHDEFYYDADVPKDEWGAMLQVNRELGNHRFTIGSDLKWGECESTYKYEDGDRIFSGKQDLYSVFINDEMLVGEKLILNAGGRYDQWTNHNGNFFDNTTSTERSIEYPETSDEAFSPSAGAAYKLTEDTKLRVSFGTGFKAPSLYYLYKSGPHGSTRFDLANPDLKAETMPWSYDLGFDTKANDNLNLTFTFYQSQFKDFLGDKTLDPEEVPSYFTPDEGMDVIQKVNMGRVDIYGVEAGMEYDFNRRWSAFVNHTYNISKIKEYEEEPEVEGNYLSYTPRHMTKIGFTYDNPQLFTLSLYITNVGARFGDFENTDKKKVEACQVVDMKISRKLFDGMELFASVDNLTDEEYMESYTTYNPPLTAMVGVEYTF